MTELTVRAGSAQYGYRIGAGLLGECGSALAALHAPCRAALVTDSNVDALYADTVSESLLRAGFRVYKQVIAPGEGSKSPAALWDILGFFAESGLGRQDIAVALGGGVVGDLAGFAAAVYMRGIAYISLPTTLLSAVDSSIGGKTAIDLPQGKNLAGAFHQPLLALCDTGALFSLPPETLAYGAAEVVKYGMLGEAELLALTPEALLRGAESVIARCAAQKAALVAEDTLDTGRRRLLNFGHTFAHALERLSGYAMPHGEAVARGMALAARGAFRLGLSAEDCFPALSGALERWGLPDGCPYAPKTVAAAALSDKKRSGDTITLVLPKRPGECFLYDINTDKLADFCRAGTAL